MLNPTVPPLGFCGVKEYCGLPLSKVRIHKLHEVPSICQLWMTPCAPSGVSEGPKWGKTEGKAHTGPYLGPGWPGRH